MKVGLLVTGDVSVRAAHTLQAHPEVDQVVVVGPARSKSFQVVADASSCDYLVGSGESAVTQAQAHSIPLIWDGDHAADGVAVWGASPIGITLAIASRESDPRLVALAHPDLPEESTSTTIRFPKPVGRLGAHDASVDGHPIALARSSNRFAACLAEGETRRVTMVDDGAFMSGIALAAGIATVNSPGEPVWNSALPYLETTTQMGLVMAESG